MLTIRQIKNAKPADKQRKLFDRDGLYLVVTLTGSKRYSTSYLTSVMPARTAPRSKLTIALQPALKAEAAMTASAKPQAFFSHVAKAPCDDVAIFDHDAMAAQEVVHGFSNLLRTRPIQTLQNPRGVD